MSYVYVFIHMILSIVLCVKFVKYFIYFIFSSKKWLDLLFLWMNTSVFRVLCLRLVKIPNTKFGLPFTGKFLHLHIITNFLLFRFLVNIFLFLKVIFAWNEFIYLESLSWLAVFHFFIILFQVKTDHHWVSAVDSISNCFWYSQYLNT